MLMKAISSVSSNLHNLTKSRDFTKFHKIDPKVYAALVLELCTCAGSVVEWTPRAREAWVYIV